jgi:hypothetical protein
VDRVVLEVDKEFIKTFVKGVNKGIKKGINEMEKKRDVRIPRHLIKDKLEDWYKDKIKMMDSYGVSKEELKEVIDGLNDWDLEDDCIGDEEYIRSKCFVNGYFKGIEMVSNYLIANS